MELLLSLLFCLSIGPRFVLNPIRIFEGSFGGPTLFQNPHYVSPNDVSRIVLLYSTKILLKYMFMIGTINMEMNGPCKYMYMYFWGKKGSLYNLYDGVLEYLCNATCTCIPPNNLTKDTYQEIKNFIKKHSPVQYLLAIVISVCPLYLVLIFYNFCINSYERGYR